MTFIIEDIDDSNKAHEKFNLDYRTLEFWKSVKFYQETQKEIDFLSVKKFINISSNFLTQIYL
jgi:hypothetical protein